MPQIQRFLHRTRFTLIILISITIFNIFNAIFLDLPIKNYPIILSSHQTHLSETPSSKAVNTSVPEQQFSKTPNSAAVNSSVPQQQLSTTPSSTVANGNISQQQLSETPTSKVANGNISQQQLSETPSSKVINTDTPQQQLSKTPTSTTVNSSVPQQQLSKTTTSTVVNSSVPQQQLSKIPSSTVANSNISQQQQLPETPTSKVVNTNISQQQLSKTPTSKVVNSSAPQQQLSKIPSSTVANGNISQQQLSKTSNSTVANSSAPQQQLSKTPNSTVANSNISQQQLSKTSNGTVANSSAPQQQLSKTPNSTVANSNISQQQLSKTSNSTVANSSAPQQQLSKTPNSTVANSNISQQQLSKTPNGTVANSSAPQQQLSKTPNSTVANSNISQQQLSKTPNGTVANSSAPQQQLSKIPSSTVANSSAPQQQLSKTSNSTVANSNISQQQLSKTPNGTVANSSAPQQQLSKTPNSTVANSNISQQQLSKTPNSTVANSSAPQQQLSKTPNSTVANSNISQQQLSETPTSKVVNSSSPQQQLSKTPNSTVANSNISQQKLSKTPNGTVANSSAPQQQLSKTPNSTVANSNISQQQLSETPNSRVATSTPTQKESSNTATPTISTEPSPMKGSINYYELINDTNYHYEFRFEYTDNSTNDDPRLMILLNGSVRTCVDYWDFSVGRRILATLHSFKFLILVICSKRRTYDRQGPVQKNADVKWIYTSLQKWMNEVYYKEFQRYPRLYIHGISRGSKIAALLCRVLPIQQQIFTIFPGHWQGLVSSSDYPIDLQKRLQLDPVFANWFYFDFCYNTTMSKTNISKFCPFESESKNYQPVPPTYFVHTQNDRLFSARHYTSIIDRMRKESFGLGGKLLNHTDGVKFFILPPSNATPTYMQQMYNKWHSKPHASKIFYEHYINPILYNASNANRQTCNCLRIDFRYFQLYPNITEKWSKQKQEEYKDYVNDIELCTNCFCEDVCGDLYTDHAMVSRELDKMIEWVNKMDSIRQSLLIEDYLSRPLRIWMYDKNSIMTNKNYSSANEANYVNILKEYHMYSPEYYLQDYFQQMKASNTFARHNLQWASNPLLADYFIIPNDLTYYYFSQDLNTMPPVGFTNLVNKLNTDYFETLLNNIRTMFRYWTMAKQADQMGSNHILPIMTGKNMGFFSNHTQNILKNIMQLVFTGLRQDMLPPDAPPPHDHQGTIIIYRHGYDVVIPQFTRVKRKNSISQNLSVIVKNKKRLFFFAGAMNETMTSQSARPLLWSLWKDMTKKNKDNMTIEIQRKHFNTLSIIDGHQKPDEYIESIQSTVFSVCPEGYFPWSPQLYDAIQLGTIPLVLADNIVLPFERFIDWRSISAKINISHIKDLFSYVDRIENFEQYITQKLTNALPHANAFKWPYSAVGEDGQNKHIFLPDEDRNGSVKNPLYYVSLELRCRRLEQLYGLTVESFSNKSIEAQKQACTAHPTICPCHDQKRSVAFQEYL